MGLIKELANYGFGSLGCFALGWLIHQYMPKLIEVITKTSESILSMQASNSAEHLEFKALSQERALQQSETNKAIVKSQQDLITQISTLHGFIMRSQEEHQTSREKARNAYQDISQRVDKIQSQIDDMPNTIADKFRS